MIFNTATWCPATECAILYTSPNFFLKQKVITQGSDFMTLQFIFIFLRINTFWLTTVSFIFLVWKAEINFYLNNISVDMVFSVEEICLAKALVSVLQSEYNQIHIFGCVH